MKRNFLASVALAAMATAAAGAAFLKRAARQKARDPYMMRIRPRRRDGRDFIAAHLSPARATSLRKLARAARKGQITLMRPTAKAIARHEWSSRPGAARS